MAPVRILRTGIRHLRGGADRQVQSYSNLPGSPLASVRVSFRCQGGGDEETIHMLLRNCLSTLRGTPFRKAAALFVLPGVLLPVASLAACQLDETTPDSDASVVIPETDAAVKPDTSTAADGGVDTGVDAARPPAVCLTDATLAELVDVKANFPFCVTRKYDLDEAPVTQLNWGGTGFTSVNAAGTKSLAYAVPAAATGKVTPVESNPPAITSTPAPCPANPPKPDPCGTYFNGTPAPSPIGPLWSYTASGLNFPGEALLLNGSLAVASRAFSNGIYALAVVNGSTPRVVASALSPLAAARNANANKNGLYVSEFCNNALVPTGACKSFQLLEVGSVSGPIALDATTDNLVAFEPDFSGVAATVQAFSFTKKDVMDATGKVTRTPFATFVASGSQSVALVPPAAGSPGWALNKNYDDFGTGAKAAVEGADYTITNGAFVNGTQSVVIAHGTKADDLNLVTDNEGDLWVVVTLKDGKGALVELRRKP